MPYLTTDGLLPFQSGSETSRDGAVFAQKFATSQRQRLLAWYRQRGPMGGTDREAEVALGLTRQALCARRNALIKDGLVVKDDGHRRAGAYAGVLMAVWRIKE